MMNDEGFDGISLRDRLMIADLLARYSLARDDRRIVDLMACFSVDGRFVRQGKAVNGRDEIKKFFDASVERYDITRHITHTHVLEPCPTGIRGVVTGSADLVSDGVLVQAAYRYWDLYVFEQERWLIAEREIAFMYAMPPAEFSVGFQDVRRIRWPHLPPTEAQIQ